MRAHMLENEKLNEEEYKYHHYNVDQLEVKRED